MKKVISMALATLTIAGCIQAPVFAAEAGYFQQVNEYTVGQFTDVAVDSWAADAIKRVYELGVMSGEGEGRFNPDGNLTVAQAISMACRINSTYTGQEIPTVEQGAGVPWYASALAYAKEHDISTGIQENFDVPATRANFAVILGSSLPDEALEVIGDIEDGAIPDVSGVYADAVYRLYRAGVISGNDKQGTFAPESTITRGAAAAIVSRLVEPSLRQGITLVKPPFSIIPVDQLSNKKSLKEKCTEAEFQAAYDEALKIVAPLADKPIEEQLKGIATELRSRFLDGGSYSMDEDHYSDPYGYLVLNTASCAGCARATGLCLNMLGIEYEHVNENQYSHQWARVNVGGTYWICDAFGMYCGPESEPYAHPYF